MISQEQAHKLIQEALNSLHRSGLLEEEISADENTVLLGSGSALDSIAFVTFVTDLEDRLNQLTSEEVVLVLDEIHNFNAENPCLAISTLAEYIASIVA
jgi:hypothetical protein